MHSIQTREVGVEVVCKDRGGSDCIQGEISLTSSGVAHGMMKSLLSFHFTKHIFDGSEVSPTAGTARVV